MRKEKAGRVLCRRRGILPGRAYREKAGRVSIQAQDM